MSVSADTLTRTRLCKTPGCPGEATARMGPYAGLCDTCKVNQKRKLSVAHGGNGRLPKRPPVSLRDVSVREIAETPLGPPASRLEVAVALLRDRRRQADEARKTARELTARALEAKAHADTLEIGYRDALQKLGL